MTTFVFRLSKYDEKDLHAHAATVEAKEVAPGRFKKTLGYQGLRFVGTYGECPDCAKPWPSCPVVYNWLWKHAGFHRRSVACVPCLEKRLGRQLVYQDLKNPTSAYNEGYASQLPRMPEDEWEAFVASVLGTKET